MPASTAFGAGGVSQLPSAKASVAAPVPSGEKVRTTVFWHGAALIVAGRPRCRPGLKIIG
jgi:hypothetical protein